MSGFLSKLFSWIKPGNQKIPNEINSQIGSSDYYAMKKVHFASANSNPFSESHYYVSTGTQTEAREHARTSACGTMTDTVEFPIDSFDLEPIKTGKEIKTKTSLNQTKKAKTVKYGFQAPISNSGTMTFDFTFHNKDPDKSLKKDKPTTNFNPETQRKTSIGTFSSQKASNSDYGEEDQFSETNNYSNSTEVGSDQQSETDTSNVTDE